MAIDHTEKVRLLVALCRELACFGLHAVLCDARPALWLPTGPAEPRRWVSVSRCGEFFEWWHDTGASLVVADPRSAARRIAREVRTRPGGPDDPLATPDQPATRIHKRRG